MPKFTYTEEEVPVFELLKSGPFAYEVVGFEQGIQNGGSTNGCDKVDLKLKLFTDATFTKPVGQFTKLLIFPQTGKPDTDRFLQGGLNMFIKSAGIEAAVGGEIELDEHTCMRRRGWCHVTQKQVIRNKVPQFIDGDPKRPEMRNEIDRFITDRPRIERAAAKVETDEAF